MLGYLEKRGYVFLLNRTFTANTKQPAMAMKYILSAEQYMRNKLVVPIFANVGLLFIQSHAKMIAVST